MMDGGMASMMAWMMGFGLLGWALVIALLATIVVLLFQLLTRRDPRPPGERQGEGRDHKPLQQR
jgi:hypothetical protein